MGDTGDSCLGEGEPTSCTERIDEDLGAIIKGEMASFKVLLLVGLGDCVADELDSEYFWYFLFPAGEAVDLVSFLDVL